ncbi:hypothetical protein [Chryseobacterium sp. c4a]|uniref:hypothetical protein n=1 Tax=Chryseobacterium sp. c4a TaxID=1573582 RepID=UPI00135753C4|nr:hypothetical protein [Chryseobacterium sp. c4a]
MVTIIYANIYSLFPIPYSLFPITYYLLPITYYLLPITYYCSSFIINVPYPSPDRNGYPAARVGEREGWSIGEKMARGV